MLFTLVDLPMKEARRSGCCVMTFAHVGAPQKEARRGWCFSPTEPLQANYFSRPVDVV